MGFMVMMKRSVGFEGGSRSGPDRLVIYFAFPFMRVDQLDHLCRKFLSLQTSLQQTKPGPRPAPPAPQNYVTKV